MGKGACHQGLTTWVRSQRTPGWRRELIPERFLWPLHKHVYMHRHTHTHMHTYTHVCTHARMHARTYTFTLLHLAISSIVAKLRLWTLPGSLFPLCQQLFVKSRQAALPLWPWSLIMSDRWFDRTIKGLLCVVNHCAHSKCRPPLLPALLPQC